jgi:hypothetical protein
MATTSKSEKVFIGDENGNPIELTGADKEAFLQQRAKDQAELEALKSEAQAQKELKISAYTKLGLTEQEINAIL